MLQNQKPAGGSSFLSMGSASASASWVGSADAGAGWRATTPGVPSSSLSEGYRLCPVDRGRGVNTWMAPTLLYGVRIDISPNGIWFDANELNRILDSMKSDTVPFLARWFKEYKTNASPVSDQINAFIRVLLDFASKERRYQELALIMQRGGPEKAVVVSEYERLSGEIQAMRQQLLKPIDITPGKKVEVPKPQPQPGPIPTEGYRLCPHARAYGQSVVMAKVKLLGQVLDASEHGIWFDSGELVTVLQSFQNRPTGILASISNFLRQGNVIDHLRYAVAERLNLIKLKEQKQKELEQARAAHNFPMEQSLMEEYVQLGAKIMEAYDITPTSLRG